MKRLLALAALTLAPALAESTSLQQYIQASGGKFKLQDNILVVSKRTSDLNYLILGVTEEEGAQGRLNRVGIFAFKQNLTPAELDLLASNVTRIGSKCFNISPERGEDIAAWLKRKNRTISNVSAESFGPVDLTFVRNKSHFGDWFTGIYLQRTGVPGVMPWKNYCTP